MSLDEATIRLTFPSGACQQGKNKWKPADEGKADRSLGELLKEKRKRQEKPRYLHRSYSRDNYTPIPSEALGKDKHGHGAPEEAVDEATQERFTQEARERRSVTHAEEQQRAQVRSCLARLRQLSIQQVKAGRDPGPMLEEFVAQLEERKAA